ncbi:MAG TPA: TonB-dependent receptor plug domain-containing protein [Holophagaceae bacterium]|nr:TonB-dependent receptor plug domain-containing protein [Holophagaceae bacterium]
MTPARPELLPRRAARRAAPVLASLLAQALAAQAPAPGTPPAPDARIAQSPAPAPPPAPVPALATSRDITFAAADRPLPVDGVPGHIQVFILEDLERSGARTVGEFLARELPAQFQQTGGPGLPVYAYQGGARPEDTLVLLDGLRLSDPSQPALDLATLPLTGVVRLEILTGTDSTRFGPGAQGGVVAIYTAAASARGASGELAGQGGSGGQGQGRALPSFGWSGGWFHAGSQARQEDQSTETPEGYRTTTSFGAFGQRMGPVSLTLAYRNHYQGVPDPYAVATDQTRIYDPTRTSSYRSQSGTLGLQWDLGLGFALVLSGGSQSVDRLDPRPGTSPVLIRSTGRTDQGDLALVFGSGGFGLRLHAGGFLARDEQGFTGSALINLGHARHGDVGLELAYEPVPRLRLSAEGGIQSDRATLRPLSGSGSEHSDHASTFRGTLNLRLPLGFRFYAGGGQGYNAPSLPQWLANAGTGAPVLGPERNGFGFAGFGWGRGHWNARVGSNRSTYRDALVFNGFTWKNEGHLRVQGTEATLGYTRGGFGGEGFVRAQEARDLDAPADPFRTPNATNRPFQSHGLKVFGGWSRVRLDLSYRQVGAGYQVVSGPIGRGGAAAARVESVVTYQVLDTTATFTLGRHWTLIARGENLLQPRTTVDQWLAQAQDTQADAYRTFGYPAQGAKGSLEVIFRY